MCDVWRITLLMFVQLDVGKKLQQLHRRQLQLQHSVVVVQVHVCARVFNEIAGCGRLTRIHDVTYDARVTHASQAAVAALEARADAAQ